MNPKHQDSDTPDGKTPQSPLPIAPFTSITLSLPTHFISPPKPPHFSSQIPKTLTIPSQFSPFPSKTLKIPSQITSLFNLSLTASTPTPPLSKSTLSSNSLHLQTPLFRHPLRPSHPSSAAALRRASVVWFRNDLRVQDNESLASANNESMSVLPLFIFDPKDFGKSPSGFDKTGPNRAAFLIESVADLRKNLQSKGSNLVVKIGDPLTVLTELAKKVGAEAVYVHREVSRAEVRVEEEVEGKLKDEGVDVKFFWGSTLYHVEDLPFELEKMPTNHGGFREKVKGLKVRKCVESVDELKGLPKCVDLEPGEIPSLVDLGLGNGASMSQGKQVDNARLIGGETEALQRLKTLVAECEAQPRNGAKDSTYGANFSCKISSWLATGCLSPRTMFDVLNKSASRTISAGSNRKDGGDTGMNWLMYELLWRDFFRFITRKYSSTKQHNVVTACTGATV